MAYVYDNSGAKIISNETNIVVNMTHGGRRNAKCYDAIVENVEEYPTQDSEENYKKIELDDINIIGKENVWIRWKTRGHLSFSELAISILTANSKFYGGPSYFPDMTKKEKDTMLEEAPLPVTVICRYSERIISSLKRANIKYDLVEKKSQEIGENDEKNRPTI